MPASCWYMDRAVYQVGHDHAGQDGADVAHAV